MGQLVRPALTGAEAPQVTANKRPSVTLLHM